VLVTGFPAGAFAANCYVVAPARGAECVIVDPGQDAQQGIDELLLRYRLKPIAVLLTHGHIDHMWSGAELDFTVRHTPGHTPGSVTFGSENGLFSGDLLFAGSIGRTDLPGGDHQAMLRSLARTLTLPDDTLVLPGHGPQTTIGAERRTNPFLTGLVPANRGL